MVTGHPILQVAWLAKRMGPDVLSQGDIATAHYLASEEAAVTSDTSSAIISSQLADVCLDRRKLAHNRALTAAAAIQIERQSWLQLEEKIVAGAALKETTLLFVSMEAGALTVQYR